MKLSIPAQNFTRTRIGDVAVAAGVAGAMLIGFGPVHAVAIAPADSALADSLSITQPAVSKTVAELEAILGVKLFERGRHGAVPTREGQLFMPHASACVSALRQGVGSSARNGPTK